MKTFALIGAGWRSEFFLRVAAELPTRFAITAICSRTPARAQAMAERWGVPYRESIDEVFQTKPDFVVTSVSWENAAGIALRAIEHGFPVLSETPPAPGEDDLAALHVSLLKHPSARIQVAEQYFLQPLHAARLEVIAKGWIGTPSFAHVSVAHGYHGISLLRRYLGVGLELPKITARSFTAPIVESPGRSGPPKERRIVDSNQTIAHFDWNGKLGVFDFSGDQYFSWIRAQHVQVRGESGEIQNETVRRLLDSGLPVVETLRRVNAGECGNLEGHHLKGYTAGSDWIYQNPSAPARLTDDEIAIASCLEGMAKYLDTGDPVYPVKEAMFDRYLDIYLHKAIETGDTITVPRPAWL